jgi:hypothetical protein
VGSVDSEGAHLVEIWLAEDRGDQRSDQTFDDGVDDSNERRADDHGDSKVDDVALGDEISEALEHGVP